MNSQTPNNGNLLFNWETQCEKPLVESLKSLSNPYQGALDLLNKKNMILSLFLASYASKFVFNLYHLSKPHQSEKSLGVFDEWQIFLGVLNHLQDANKMEDFKKKLKEIPETVMNIIQTIDLDAKNNKKPGLQYLARMTRIRWMADVQMIKKLKKSDLTKTSVESILNKAPEILQKVEKEEEEKGFVRFIKRSHSVRMLIQKIINIQLSDEKQVKKYNKTHKTENSQKPSF